MKFKNEQEWILHVEANKDSGYGMGVMDYAERWANLMEKALEEGACLSDVADAISHEADTDGITGFMYGCAVSILSKCWVYGEELRLWHNIDVQIQNEGERANESDAVLNPALLSIG